ncbi:MAG: SulP family inorganic anion transporter [Myxococcota bacterium]
MASSPFAFLDLADLDPRAVRRELFPALAVAIMGIPQGIAYALIAGLPPAMGLYASAVPAIVGALLRSSRQVIVGPTNAVSLLFATSIAARMEDPVSAAATLALLVGALQVGAGFLQLGSLVDYISAAVVTGYVTGAATQIAVGQLANATGTHAQPGDILTRFGSWLGSLGDADPYAIGLATLSVVIVVWLRRYLPRGVPMLIALLATTAVTWLFSLHEQGVQVIRDLAPIPAALPPIELPALHGAIALFPAAVATTVLSLVESTSIARTLASKSGERFDVTTDFVGLGAANLAAAFFGGYPVSGSLARSALAAELGGRTRLVGVGAGLAMIVVGASLGPVVNFAPIPGIAGVILIVAADLIDVKRIRALLSAGSTDRFAFLGTVLGAWILPLDQAIYVGVGISIVLFLRRARLLIVRELVLAPDKTFREVELGALLGGEAVRCASIRVVHVEGPLFFGAAGELEQALFSLIDDPEVRVVIVRLKRAHGIDFTTAAVLEHAHAVMAAGGRHLMLVGMRKDVMERLENIGVAEAFAEGELYPTEPGWFQAMHHALERAVELVDAAPSTHRCALCPIARYVHGTPPPVDRRDDQPAGTADPAIDMA